MARANGSSFAIAPGLRSARSSLARYFWKKAFAVDSPAARYSAGEGKPFGEQLAKFRALVAASVVLPVNESVAERAAGVWSQMGPRARKAIGDILIASTASVHRLPLVTRNRRDFEPMARCAGMDLLLIDWSQ